MEGCNATETVVSIVRALLYYIVRQNEKLQEETAKGQGYYVYLHNLLCLQIMSDLL